MQVDIKRMASMANELFAYKIHQDDGPEGVQALRILIPMIRATHDAVTTERLSRGLTVLRFTAEQQLRLGNSAPAVFTSTRELTAWYRSASGPLTICCAPDGKILAWTSSVDLQSLPGQFVAYRYSGYQQECFVTPNGVHPVSPYGNFPSYFAIPYFIDLRESLVRYGEISVKKAQCDTFRSSWVQEKRIFFVRKPEATMRRSLQSYLRASLRNHGPIEVMPEQNVDETHPVDLKVLWTTSNRVAIIEIKWLGLSHDTATGKTTRYTTSRALSGAKQLADYLDSYHENSPDNEARGILAVFDGRRQSVNQQTVSVSREDGLHYMSAEIMYQEGILDRDDFEHPVRFFCEPVCD